MTISGAWRAEAVAARVSAVSEQAERALAALQGRAKEGRGAAEPPPERFTLQVSAFQDRAEAQAQVDRLRERGHNPYLTSSVVPGRGRWYRVRIGRFDSKGAAEAFRRKFEAAEGTGCFVTRL